MRKLFLAVFVALVTCSGCVEQTKPSFVSVGKKYKTVHFPGFVNDNVTVLSDKGNGWYECEGEGKDKKFFNFAQAFSITE